MAISDPSIKAQIREAAAEEEERRSYEGRMSEEWLQALAPLGTDWHKPYLEVVPWIVVLFAQRHGVGENGEQRQALLRVGELRHRGGAVRGRAPRNGPGHAHPHAVAHGIPFPDPRSGPLNEKPIILFPWAIRQPDARVPDLSRKPLDDVSVWFEKD